MDNTSDIESNNSLETIESQERRHAVDSMSRPILYYHGNDNQQNEIDHRIFIGCSCFIVTLVIIFITIAVIIILCKTKI
jgi:hypothetical protein